ncbi:rhamnogalacturonan lyase family protein [Pseudarthrobacter raffinosi]|uniref:rhamnogalacturonan lyase family protein n=1 Tax=Pseudarthrobacter raffinosi TaxID=2953651 RepID=UPI00403FAAC5
MDTYKADGTLLHRIDLGVNIRSGAHYTQMLVNDFRRRRTFANDVQDSPGHQDHLLQSGRLRGRRVLHLAAAEGPRRRPFQLRRLPDERRRLLPAHGGHVPGLARPPRGQGRQLARHPGRSLRHRPAVPVPAVPARCRSGDGLLHGCLRARPECPERVAGL